MKKYLLTGIPRSGTTLSCKILNSLPNVVALHEPLSPNQFNSKLALDACEEVKEKLSEIQSCLLAGKPFMHGHKASLQLDNPIEVSSNGGLRKLTATRGQLTLPPQPANTNLVVKQNALFAALLPQLSSAFNVIAIIRNPVDVLLSWQSVDLPINKGRIPAGEKYNNSLKSYLNKEQVISKRQTYIYQWFVKQYQSHYVKVIKYEDIIDSQGSALTSAFGFEERPNLSLKNVRRQFEPELLRETNKIVKSNLTSLVTPYYKEQEIMLRLNEVNQLVHD